MEIHYKSMSHKLGTSFVLHENNLVMQEIKSEPGRACDLYGGGERCTQGFGG